jgi:hypothetical protein
MTTRKPERFLKRGYILVNDPGPDNLLPGLKMSEDQVNYQLCKGYFNPKTILRHAGKKWIVNGPQYQEQTIKPYQEAQ